MSDDFIELLDNYNIRWPRENDKKTLKGFVNSLSQEQMDVLS